MGHPCVRLLAGCFVLGLVACPGRRPATSSTDPSLVLPSAQGEPEAAAPFGSGLWREEGGMRLFLPEGWTGQPGPLDSGLLVTFHHLATGVEVEIWAFERSGHPTARPRPSCTWSFHDDASHRIIPILAPAVSGSCLSDDPFGEVVQGWYGLVGDREVHVEVIYPHGRMVEGRKVVEPLLKDLGWR